MRLGNLLKSVNKKYQKIPISGISFDSRRVIKENLFFAIEGIKISGSKWADTEKAYLTLIPLEYLFIGVSINLDTPENLTISSYFSSISDLVMPNIDPFK